jgi:diguanylate cyclase
MRSGRFQVTASAQAARITHSPSSKMKPVFSAIGMNSTGETMAYEAAGHLEWDRSYVIVSILSGAFFGAIATNRIARPVTRFSKYGSSIALVLAIVSTHFIGMAGLTIDLDPSIAISPEIISGAVMTGIVCAAMVIILLLGASTYVIDMQSTQAAVERYRHLALHDPLTNLPNRAAFNEHLAGLTNRPVDMTAHIAVLCFDLDRFKEINDVHGSMGFVTSSRTRCAKDLASIRMK